MALLGLVLIAGRTAIADEAGPKDAGPRAATVTTSPTASTRLYVRTVPDGAKIEIDGKPSGKSDQTFKVPPGVRKMTVKVELDGHYPREREVEIRGGRITRVILELEPTPDAAETPSSPWAKPGEPTGIPRGSVMLSHVGERSTDKRSMAGSGHAVRFERPEGAKYVCAVQIYGSRYGEPEPPKEDFRVYLLDGDMKVIQDFGYPYAMIRRTDEMHWHTLPMAPTEVPKQFFVAVSFNPHQTKGIYLGLDKSVKEQHSHYGLPDEGYEEVPDGDWMVRACLVPEPKITTDESPFADQFSE
jgi:hypothetical protein